MKKYNKIHVISDIHGYYPRLLAASKVATREQPLFVLGDLFDHYYGDERKIINLILKLAAEQKLVLIIGNHDQVIQTAFESELTPTETIEILTKEKNIKKFKIFNTLFSESFYAQFILIKDRLLTPGFDDESKLNRFYSEIKELSTKPEYYNQYQQLQSLFSLFKSHDEVEINGLKLLLSHSGNIEDTASRDTVKPYFQLDSRYDYGVMGHLTIPAVKQMISEETDMINFEQNFELNSKVTGLNITGTYMYNHHSKMIMIDNGSYKQRVVTIKCDATT